ECGAALHHRFRRPALTVSIILLDVNDCPPSFTSQTTAYIQENTPVDTLVFRAQASDADSGPNSYVEYSLKAPFGNKFSVGNIDGGVVLLGELDREEMANYSLTIVATDKGEPPLSSSMEVTLIVLDVNDNTPSFSQNIYDIEIEENTLSGADVLQVFASDADEGTNGQIHFSIAGGNANSDFRIDSVTENSFSINRATGEIRTTRPLDREKVAQYSLRVKATDRGSPPKSTAVKVLISVLDVNDNAPRFSKIFSATVPENAPVGFTVTRVTTIDEDAGANAISRYSISDASLPFIIHPSTGDITISRPLNREDTDHYIAKDKQMNGLVTYNISSGNDDGLFSINSQTGVLSLAKPLDYETKQKRELRVSATDGGWIAKTSYVTVNVLVTDVNDNPPVFDPVEYFPVVQENVPSGTTVVKMNATDKDSGPNALMAYVIQSSDSDLFIIDPNTGIITTQGFLDYEAKQVYHLTVKAFNVPDEERCSFAYVNIQLRGANEYVPRFVSKQYYFEVSEAASNGTVVGEVFASDRDLGEDGIVYYLIFGRSRKKGFSINKKTGQIYVAGPLDREKEEEISLKVLAKNEGSIRGADIDEVLVNITILDANDPPVFTQELYDVQVNEGLSPGGLVTFVSAEDSDSVPSWSRFTYAITANYEKSTFTINPQTGQVSVASELDRETVPVYNLTVLAVDSGSPAATGSAILIVTLEDINDNGPTLETTSGEVMENQRAGTPVITLSSSDPDLAPNQGPFSYSLVSTGAASSYFTLSPTGELTTSREIDREQISDFYLSVIIKDSGIPQISFVKLASSIGVCKYGSVCDVCL
uniref:Protocadherin Fat 4-like n=1 Tax=Sinocyclocheilus anshuiensis TaxID=1608454 RepID=A0A671TBK8_9TELE